MSFINNNIIFFNYVGMLLQPVMAGLPGGPQTDKEKKQAKPKTKQNTRIRGVQRNNDMIQNKSKRIVIMYYTIYTVVLYKSQHCVCTYCPFKSSWVICFSSDGSRFHDRAA